MTERILEKQTHQFNWVFISPRTTEQIISEINCSVVRWRQIIFLGGFPRRFRRATNARLSCATRRARGVSNVRDGRETSFDAGPYHS